MQSHNLRYFSTFGKAVSDVTIGVPKETFTNERRVALSPEAVQRLIKVGFKINVQTGAGEESAFKDSEYQKLGAGIVSYEEAMKSDLVLKVRAPSKEEVGSLQDEAGLISLMAPA